MVPKSPGHRGKRGGRQVGQTRGRRTRRPWSGMVRDEEPGRHCHPETLPHATVTREILRQDAKSWTRKMLGRTGNRKYRPSDRQKPDPTVAKANKRIASRFYQFKKMGQLLNRPVPVLDHPTPGCHLLVVPIQHPRPGSIFSRTAPKWRSQQKTLWATVLKETRKLPGPAREKRRTSIAELLADERCSQAVLPVPSNYRRRPDVRPTGGRGRRGCGQRGLGVGSERPGGAGLGEEGGGGEAGEGVTRRLAVFVFLSFFTFIKFLLFFFCFFFVFTITGANGDEGG